MISSCDVDCDATHFENGDLSRAMMINDDQRFTCKSLCCGILVVVGRLWSIYRITTTNQEVAASSTPVFIKNTWNR
jgi:hypothetical protein